MSNSKAREAARDAVDSARNHPFDVSADEIAAAAIDAYIAALGETPDLKELNARVDFGLLKVGIDHGSGIDGECTLYSDGILIAAGIETDNARFIAAVINAYRAMLNAAAPQPTSQR